MFLSVKSYDIPLNDSVIIQITGRHVVLISAGEACDLTVLRKNTPIGKAEGIEQGLGYGPTPEVFEAVKLATSSGAAQTVTVAISDEPITYNRLSGSITTANPSRFDGSADVSLLATAATLILAADTSRKEAYITNLTGNTQEFRIGGNGTCGAAEGTPLPVGQQITVTGGGAVYGYNPGGVAESVAISIVRD